MSRETKTQALVDYATRCATPQRSMTPRQSRLYGRYVPGQIVAAIYLRLDRGARRHLRSTWAESRLQQRRRINGRAPGPHHHGERGFFYAR